MLLSQSDDRRLDTPEAARCACGDTLATTGNVDSVTCPQCGRIYGREYLNDAGPETISIDSDVESPGPIRLSSHDPNIGRRLGHFRILSRIGVGGMGAVYHAQDESLQRPVALKVILNAPKNATAAYLDRLFREARAQAGVNHPHVAHVYYVGTEGETPFLAMEWVPSGTLGDRIRRGPLPFEKIIRYAIQITQALQSAAADDIVHGDIKPSNVLLVDDQNVKLSDFGLARRLSDPSPTSKLSGTPDYMPPEATQGGRADHLGDMYSLGVTLFQLSFGRLPYRSDSDATLGDQLRLHREAEVDFPERWPAGLPESWNRILTTLLAKDPARRFANFTELESELRKLAPAPPTVANPLARTVAWMIDSALLAAGLVLIQVISRMLHLALNPVLGGESVPFPQLGFVGVASNLVLGSGFLIAIVCLQMHWGNTTGKRFLQLLIVDQHGLKPRRRVLAIRALFQFSWAAWLVLSGPLYYFGAGGLAEALCGLVLAMLVIEFTMLWIRGGSTLHDGALHTRVALDAHAKS